MHMRSSNLGTWTFKRKGSKISKGRVRAPEIKPYRYHGISPIYCLRPIREAGRTDGPHLHQG